MIITKTPFRISFFGGGTDYPDWYREHEGSVLATTIDKYCYISSRHLPPFFEHKHRIVYSKIENVKLIEEINHPAVRGVLNYENVTQGLEIHHDGDLPARAGLGSSSAFTVGLINALRGLDGKIIGKEDLAREAIHIEQNILNENVGSQDQISAAYGGFNRIVLKRDDSFFVEPVTIRPERQLELKSHLMLFFTGLPRIADVIAKSKIANIPKRQNELFFLQECVNESLKILHSNNCSISEFGELLDQSWQHKRNLSEKVSTPFIDSLYEQAKIAGAIGGKILGAGGGGFMLLFAKPEFHSRIKDRLSKLIFVDFNFESTGSRVVLYQPNGL